MIATTGIPYDTKRPIKPKCVNIKQHSQGVNGVSLLLAGCEPLLPGSSNSDQQVVQEMILVARKFPACWKLSKMSISRGCTNYWVGVSMSTISPIGGISKSHFGLWEGGPLLEISLNGDGGVNYFYCFYPIFKYLQIFNTKLSECFFAKLWLSSGGL